MSPRGLAWLLAALITLPLASSVFQVPVQVSDSLEAIVISAKYPSTSQLFNESIRFSATTLRPMRYLQTRWLMHSADGTGLTYNTVFRGVHVGLLLLLVGLFVAVVRVRDWIHLAAFSVALPVFIGIHTFVAVLQEAFPVNHYAEVAVCVLGVFALADGRPRWFTAPLVCFMLAFTLSVIESGVMVWIAALSCAAAGMRGMTRTTVATSTLVFVGYLAMRQVLEISSPGIGGHGSGFGGAFYSPEEILQRFGAHPLGFMLYNVVGGMASLLLSEPRQGVYSLVNAWHSGTVNPILAINMLSSIVTTGLLVWFAATQIRGGRAAWSDGQRMFMAASGVMFVNAALTAAYIKDEIISPGGVCYAIAAFIAIAALLESMPRRSLAAMASLTFLLTVTAGLWAFRAAGVHYVLRYDAFKLRNDWVEVLREDKRDDWPTDPMELAITRRVRDEVIARRVASPSFMPRWADRYWVE